MNDKQKYNVLITKVALDLLGSRGMTVEKLRETREKEVARGIKSETDQMYYDVILAAIELMSRPMFQ